MDFGQPFGGLIPGARGAALGVLLRTDEPLTGRQIHRLTGEAFSLWSIQEALKDLARQGLIESRVVGPARVHTINNDHAFVSALRSMVSPLSALRCIVADFVDADVQAIILHGSVARGEASVASDIDLAVIATSGWDHRVEVQDAVSSRLGNACDVMVFTEDDFARSDVEPVLADIWRDGVTLAGRIPRRSRSVA